MPRYSEAKLRGIKLPDLYKELPTHPSQIYNAMVWEYRAKKYWREYREREEMWLGVFLDAPEPEEKTSLEYFTQIPEK